MAEADILARVAASLHDRRVCGFSLARPRGGSRAQVYCAKPGVGKWAPVEDCINELSANTGYSPEIIMKALMEMSLPHMNFKVEKTLSQKLESLVHRAQSKVTYRP